MSRRFSRFINVVFLVIAICLVLYVLPWYPARVVASVGTLVTSLLLIGYLIKNGKLTR